MVAGSNPAGVPRKIIQRYGHLVHRRRHGTIWRIVATVDPHNATPRRVVARHNEL